MVCQNMKEFNLKESKDEVDMKKVKSWSYLGLAAMLFVGVVEPVLAQTTGPILRVEMGAHNAGIWKIATDPSNRFLVTGSEDKTVRVWEISGGGEAATHPSPPCGRGGGWADLRRGRVCGCKDRGVWGPNRHTCTG